MKAFILPLLLLGLGGTTVSAAPPSRIDTRQTWTASWWSSELQQYGCKPVIFVFAKATFEPGNLGGTIGPSLSDGLKSVFGVTNVATQGVNYYGLAEGNYYPGGAPPWGIYDMQAIITSAAACPHSKIVVSGYSQGAAIVHRAIEGLPAATRSRIAGVATFGDTQTLQDGGRVKGYPANQTLIICNSGDIICTGMLWPLFPVHWDYVKWVPTATLFLAQAVLAANEADPWPTNSTGNGNGSTSAFGGDLEALGGELGPGVTRRAPVPTRLVAFPDIPPVETGIGS
ncbi:cutinase-domain-containing protein [Xylaria bambusicola]|uniref:cutinase-domain-containing protein n=1 Tax=Xylaria bambusicola TaxID=326684 RepID=UPI0020083A09|nr:cutinase-domain-containing protein [Xylaria bambusicola]KAI0517587.1 cutinase-domain-containing protein [Xylaria bambusicola]